jgi:RIO-like serine/threonine protein kinase
MKLDVTCMRYLSKDDYRVMTALEAGMRNHELVNRMRFFTVVLYALHYEVNIEV